ncbi:MAG: hypothetical protein ACOYN0_08925 [Phycisphaerales bacterium]
MPNGGSDCCASCWFNRNNGGTPGFHGASAAAVPYCEIRGIDVPDAYYTYCANHPHKNPGRIAIPLGPVYTGDSFGNRRVLHPAPDSEEIRATVLRLLAEIPETPKPEYPAGLSLDQVLIRQVIEWKEPRAIPHLERIAAFAVGPVEPDNIFVRDRSQLVKLATLGIAIIRGGTLA